MPKKQKIRPLQKEEFATALIAIAGDVTPKDIQDAVTKNIASQPSISRYLKGNVAKSDVATKLLNFFKARIEKRAKALA